MFTNSQGLFCQLLAGGQADATVLPADNCVVPAGVDGPFAVFITESSSPLSGDVINRQSQAVLAGPTLSFFDEKDDLTSDLIRLKL
jgi:hypothetical protein